MHALKAGFLVFATRPVSMVATLVLAVAASVISLGLLFFPAIAGFYLAVRESRREEFFIDLENVVRTVGIFFKGMQAFALGAWVLGLFGIVVSIVLLVIPVIPSIEETPAGYELGLRLSFLFIPAFWLMGSVLIHGFPNLVRGAGGWRSITTSLKHGVRTPFLALFIGFLVLFPMTGFFFHIFMIFTYPIFVGWVLARDRQLQLEPLKSNDS